MFVGYNDKAGDDVHRMWNPETNRVHNTRDIVWMKRLFYDKVVDDSNYYDDDIEDGREEDNESVDGDDEDYESDDDLASLPNLINRGYNSDSDSDDDDDDDDDD
eukprot:scaffold7674_cov267-Chaetoceros_neogracile.AAC.1